MNALDDLRDIDVYDALDRVAERVVAAVEQVSETVVRVARGLVAAACLASALLPIYYLPAIPPPPEIEIVMGDRGTAWESSLLDFEMTTYAAPTRRGLGLVSTGSLDSRMVEAQFNLAQVIAARGMSDPLTESAQRTLDEEKARYVDAVRALPPSSLDAALDRALAALDLEEEDLADDLSSSGPTAVTPSPKTPKKA